MAPAVLAPPPDLNQQLKVYCSIAEFILISRYPVRPTHPLGVPLVIRASPRLSALLSLVWVLCLGSGLGQPRPDQGPCRPQAGSTEDYWQGGQAHWSGLGQLVRPGVLRLFSGSSPSRQAIEPVSRNGDLSPTHTSLTGEGQSMNTQRTDNRKELTRPTPPHFPEVGTEHWKGNFAPWEKEERHMEWLFRPHVRQYSKYLRYVIRVDGATLLARCCHQ